MRSIIVESASDPELRKAILSEIKFDPDSLTSIGGSSWVKVVNDNRHECKTPGWLQRKRVGAEAGSQWKCGVCGQLWHWSKTQPPEGGDMRLRWSRDSGPRPVPAHRKANDK